MAHSVASQPAQEFVKWRGWPSIKDKERILAQFGTLGSGNHFAEVSEDSDGFVWVLVHSGSRGIGNKIAQHHIAIARALGTSLTGDSAPDITAHWKSRRRRLLLYPIQLPTSTAVFCFDWITDNL